MGINESVVVQNIDGSQFSESLVKKVSQHHDKAFGNVTILKDINNPNKVYIRKFLDFNSETEIQDFEVEVKLRNNFADFYSKIVNTKIEKLDKLCAKEYLLELTIEYSQTNLKNEIKKRIALKNPFLRQEIFHIFKSIVDFANALDTINSFEQLLNLENVFLYPDGRVSVIETKFLLPNTDLYQKILNLSYEPIIKEKWSILAPEQLEGIRNAKKKIDIDSSKIHSFAIGIIVLCLLSLKNIDFFFDLTKFKFLESKAIDILENSILNFETIKVLKNCLQTDPQKRISAKQMLKEIKFIKVKYDIDSNLNLGDSMF